MRFTVTVALVVLFLVALVAVPEWGSQDPGKAGRELHVAPSSWPVTTSKEIVAVGYPAPATLDAWIAERPDLFDGVGTRLALRRTALLRVAEGNRDDAITWLRVNGARFAHPLYHVGDPLHPDSAYILTSELVVRYDDAPAAAVAEQRASELGGTLVRQVTWLPGTWVFDLGPSGDALATAADLEARADVVFSHPNWLRRLPTRENVPNDPQFGNQWHLKNTGQGGGTVGADIRATFAWDTTTGSGTTIAVIDTGVDSNHIDINQVPGYNALTGAVGTTAADDFATHGTSCAGVAAATGFNGILVAGVAPSATILPIRLLQGSGFGTPTEEADSFTWAADNGADVISCSWGPDGIPFIMPALVSAAITYATTTGRGGLGCPIFWAAGNASEDIATDDYVSSPLTIAVGATTNQDIRAGYSDFGAALDFMAPSSGGSRAINTTVPGNTYTSNFGGTSASAPCAAGVAALMISVAPSLSWQSVRTLMTQTCFPVQPAAAGYNVVGHSTTYGYGRIDAEAAVLTALATLPPQLTLSVSTTGVGDITIAINNMGAFNEWMLAVSHQIYSPVGSGPLFGVGIDGFLTLAFPAGVIPFHYWANAAGNFFLGTVGVPPGLQVQAVCVELQPGLTFRQSNVVQANF